MEKKGFTEFDAKPHNKGINKRRLEIISGGLKGKAFDQDFLKDENGELDPNSLESESYTLSTFIIEKIWRGIKSDIANNPIDKKKRIPLDKDFWSNFVNQLKLIEEEYQSRLLRQAIEIQEKDPASWAREETIIVRWFYIQNLKGSEGFDVPSFRDLFTIYIKMARVAEACSQEQLGRTLTKEEYIQILKDPSFNTMMLQMMMNSRDAMKPIISLLEKDNPTPDLNNPDGVWSTKFFKLTEDEESLKMGPNEELLQKLRETTQRFFRKLEEQGRKTPQVLRCPVLPTGLFNEMCEWMYQEFNHQYLDQKYK